MIVVEERCVLHKEGAEMNMEERAGVVGRRRQAGCALWYADAFLRWGKRRG